MTLLLHCGDTYMLYIAKVQIYCDELLFISFDW